MMYTCPRRAFHITAGIVSAAIMAVPAARADKIVTKDAAYEKVKITGIENDRVTFTEFGAPKSAFFSQMTTIQIDDAADLNAADSGSTFKFVKETDLGK